MRTSENKIVKKENESLNDNKNKEDIINSNNNNININSEKKILENIIGIIEGTSTMKNIEMDLKNYSSDKDLLEYFFEKINLCSSKISKKFFLRMKIKKKIS